MIRLPYFSRSQLGVVLLLGAALLCLYAWRAHVFFSPSPPPPGTLSLAFVEVTGKVPHPGVYSFPEAPQPQGGLGQGRGGWDSLRTRTKPSPPAAGWR